MVRSSIAFSRVLNSSPETPVAMNSSCRHSPVLSMLWIVSITLAFLSVPSAWYRSQYSIATALHCHSCTWITFGSRPVTRRHSNAARQKYKYASSSL